MDDRVSRTQFQYTLEDPNADELNSFAPQMLAKLKQLPELSDVASDQQTQGIQAKLVFDRPTASRLGITASSIDQTLYDAYGQREVSTMFTQLNQYHVILEVKPGFDRTPARSAQSVHSLGNRRSPGPYPAEPAAVHGTVSDAPAPSTGRPPSASGLGGVGNSSAFASPVRRQRNRPPHFPTADRCLSALSPPPDDIGSHRDQPPGPVSGDHALLQSGAQRISGRRDRRRSIR